jgi:ArsR family transcriptional regulator, arsenate/arsenite/antimonite-responsive transcriptional repressor
MLAGILPQIRVCQLEQSCRWFEPVFLQMDEGAGQLNQPFEKIAVHALPIRQPKFFQDVMRLIEELAVKAFKVTQVMRIQIVSLEFVNQLQNLAAFFAHTDTVNPGGAREKPEVTSRLDSHHRRRLFFISFYGEIRIIMREFMNITKALADENRVRALLALRRGELCVCQITELFGLAPSTISKHLSILFQAGLVKSRKTGRWIYYQLPGKSAPVAVWEALDWIDKALSDNPQIVEDDKQLKKILKQDPAELCKRQCRK